MPIDTRFYEASFDGSTVTHFQRSGVGGQIRGPDGRVLAEYSQSIPYVECPLKLEYNAIIFIMRKLLEFNARNVFIYGDSKWVIEKLQRKTTKHIRIVDPEMKALHSEALELLREFAYHRIIWIPRESNSDAHRLCKLATRGDPHERLERYNGKAKVGNIAN